QQARLDAQLADLELRNVTGHFAYGRRDGSLDLDLNDVNLAQGTARIRLAMRDASWQSTIELKRVLLEPLAQLARKWEAPLPELSVAGEISGVVRATGNGERIREVEVDA